MIWWTAFFFLLLALSLTGAGLGIFRSGQSKGQAEGEQIANSNRYADAADREIEHYCSGLKPVDIAKCIRGVIEAANEEQRAERDLVAQTDAARWGYGALIVSGIGTAFSFLGLGGLFLSLAQTRQAIRATREIGEAQVRAYLSIVRANHAVMPHGPLMFEITVRNYGQSPARNVQFSLECRCTLNERHAAHLMPDGSLVTAPRKSVEIRYGPMHLGDIPAEGTEHSGKIIPGDLILPDNAMLDADGLPAIHSVILRAHGSDVFDKAISAVKVSKPFMGGWEVAYAAMLEEDARA